MANGYRDDKRHLRGDFSYKASNDSDRSNASTVETIDNHIYFYADVEADKCLDLIRAVREKDSELRSEHLSRGLEGQPLTPIWLHVHSYGGSLFTAFSIADQLAMIKTPIYSVVEGVTASAATLIAMSASRRYMLANSFMLIHQISSFMWGTHEQFKDELELQTKIMDRLVNFYVLKAKVKEDEVREMLKRDFWMDAEQSVKLGFVDDILK